MNDSFNIGETKIRGKIVDKQNFVDSEYRNYHCVVIIIHAENFCHEGNVEEEVLQTYLSTYNDLNECCKTIGIPIVVLVCGVEEIVDMKETPELLRSSELINSLRQSIQKHIYTMLAQVVPLPLENEGVHNKCYIYEAIMTIRSTCYLYCKSKIPPTE